MSWFLPERRESQHVPFDLNEIVRNVWLMQRGTRNSGSALDITVDLESNLPRTLGYPSQIEQVITSLIAHAEDAIAGASTDVVHSGSDRRRAGRVHGQIADNGQSRDHGADIYSGFRRRWPECLRRNCEGSRRRSVLHGTPTGTDSTFTLELPVFGQESVRTSSSVGLGKLLQNKSVLVVDDEIQISELIYDVLVRHGANVQVSSSSVDACERLIEKEYDLIICDQSMPGLSGENLLSSDEK